MTGLDLRPLSLGEILDRTFTIYRNYFLLFLAISGLPRVIVLAFQVPQVLLGVNTRGSVSASVVVGILSLGVLIVSVVATLYSQGGTVIAISEIYLGRHITIGEALGRVKGNAGTLFAIAFLNGLAILGASILLIVPGIYVACRLITAVPASLIEGRTAADSLSRSWNLTKGFAGRAFMIGLLFLAIYIAASLLFVAPFSLGAILSLRSGSLSLFAQMGVIIGGQIAAILTQPVLLIAAAIYYFDLRVRKEAFDLQFMMNPTGPLPAGPGSVPSIL
jgi:hypothetical protein